MADGSVLFVNVGRAGVLYQGDHEIKSAFDKQPVPGPVHVGRLGLDGDEQVYEGHGGPDRAVLAYSRDHYAYWADNYGLEMPEYSAFGENLTVEGFWEERVHIGDTYEVGQAVLQVTQPRPPCFKIGARYGLAKMALFVQKVGYTGILCRVLLEGRVQAGDRLVLRTREDHGVTVADANRIINVDRRDLAGAQMLLGITGLAESQREAIRARLAANGLGEDAERLYGI